METLINSVLLLFMHMKAVPHGHESALCVVLENIVVEEYTQIAFFYFMRKSNITTVDGSGSSGSAVEWPVGRLDGNREVNQFDPGLPQN